MGPSGVRARRSPPPPPALPLPIQPCSGFLGNGKAVIRPIAFKPLGGRLSAGGERYGSTPVLASRPPSHLTIYGSSSELRESRWGGSPQPASLCALPPAAPAHPAPPHRHHAHTTSKTSCIGEGKEPAPAPSPADSGVAELDRDAGHHDSGGRGCAWRGCRWRARLEEAEWALCRRAGEVALLKTQLKHAQNEQTAKGHEYLTIKSDCRQLREVLDKKEKEIMRLRSEAEEKEKTVERLQSEIDRLTTDLVKCTAELANTKDTNKTEMDKLKLELKELRKELSDISLSGYEGIQCGRTLRGMYDVCKSNEYHWTSKDSALEDAEVQRLNGETADCGESCPSNTVVERLKREITDKQTQFDNERRKWSEEKDKVLRYQKQLQINYVQMFRKSRTLEAELDSLRLEMDLCNKNLKNTSKHGNVVKL